MKTRTLTSYTVIFIIAVTLLFTSCVKNNFDDHIGKSICASPEFQYVDLPAVSNNSIDLNTQPQLFTASFNEEVPWTIVIRGVNSKSFKKYSGYGNTISVSWKGNPDTVVFFQVEQCVVEFNIACKEPIVKYFTITNTNKFSHLGYLVFDGDGGGLVPTTWADSLTLYTVAPGNSPQGGNCYCMDGNSSGPTWYFGSANFNSVSVTGLNTDPATVYINCFFNVQGSTTSIPLIRLNESGKLKDKKVFLSGTGWHYVSYKLSDLNVLNPRNIMAVVIELDAYPDRSTSGKMCFDFISFTNDAPFINSTENKR